MHLVLEETRTEGYVAKRKGEDRMIFSYGMNNPSFLATLANVTLEEILETAIPSQLLDY